MGAFPIFSESGNGTESIFDGVREHPIP
jgi:hypothetical protein